MDAARLFRSGRSQAVRLPKDQRFQGGEVAVKHFGNGVLLLAIDDPWATPVNCDGVRADPGELVSVLLIVRSRLDHAAWIRQRQG